MREREVVLLPGRVHALFPGLLLAVSLEAGYRSRRDRVSGGCGCRGGARIN